MKGLIKYLILLLSTQQVFGQSKSVTLIEYAQSTCDSRSDPHRLKSRIIAMERHSDTLSIELGFAATCCVDYVPEIRFAKDSLYFTYKVKAGSDMCFCLCCYSFTHKIKGIGRQKFTVKLDDEIIELSKEKYRTYVPAFRILDGDTVDLKDKYGLKQGIWITTSGFQFYEDNRLHNWGNIVSELHENGKLKSKCYKDHRDGVMLKCRRWDEDGNEIK